MPESRLAGAGTTAHRNEPFRALTAIRGMAAWWVVAYHFKEALPGTTPPVILAFLSRGYLAVDLFFILSGYVMALNYGSWFATSAFDLRHYGTFLRLRLSRIYPLHLFMLVMFLANPLAIALFATHRDPDSFSQIRYYILSVFLMQSWDLSSVAAWNVPAWSISTEWLAYLGFPILVGGIFPLTRGPIKSVAWMAVLLLLLAGAAAVLGHVHGPYGEQAFNLVRCVVEFSVGLALYRFAGNRQRRPQETNLAFAVSAVCFGSFAAFGLPDYLVMPLGLAALIHALSDEQGPVAGLLRIAPLQWLGLVSYSTYLSHYFLKIWTKFLFVGPAGYSTVTFLFYLGAVLGASAVLFHYIERPGQRWLRTVGIRGFHIQSVKIS